MSQYARLEIGPISVVALSRHGGQSAAPFDSLNLGSYVGDDPISVQRNFEIVRNLVGAEKLTYLNANHGTGVHLASAAGQAPPGDGLVCLNTKHAIAALSADCVPFALVDPVAKVIAVGHAGWKGVLANLMTVLTNEFIAHGANPRASTAVIGPSICGSCYEVGQERVALFKATMPSAIADETHLALANGVHQVLADLGFTIETIAGCNFEDENLFSFRRAGGGATGRGGLVAIINN